MIRFENVTCLYEGVDDSIAAIKALDDISFNIEKGSYVAIVGRNGSGKSTAARHMNALIRPTSGKVNVASMDTCDDRYIQDIRKTVGMVFQNPDNQIVSLIVEDDIAFGVENIGVPTDEIRVRIDKAMKDTGIFDLKRKSPEHLSGGQKQRVAIAGVIAMQPDCVIFDESTAMLDPGGRNDIMDIIDRLHSLGTTVIIITHFMEEAVRADRIIVMEKGRVISDGTPAEIFSFPDLVEAVGLKMPKAVKIREALKRKGLDIPDDILDIRSLAEWIILQRRKDAYNSR